MLWLPEVKPSVNINQIKRTIRTKSSSNLKYLLALSTAKSVTLILSATQGNSTIIIRSSEDATTRTNYQPSVPMTKENKQLYLH